MKYTNYKVVYKNENGEKFTYTVYAQGSRVGFKVNGGNFMFIVDLTNVEEVRNTFNSIEGDVNTKEDLFSALNSAWTSKLGKDYNGFPKEYETFTVREGVEMVSVVKTYANIMNGMEEVEEVAQATSNEEKDCNGCEFYNACDETDFSGCDEVDTVEMEEEQEGKEMVRLTTKQMNEIALMHHLLLVIVGVEKKPETDGEQMAWFTYISRYLAEHMMKDDVKGDITKRKSAFTITHSEIEQEFMELVLIKPRDKGYRITQVLSWNALSEEDALIEFKDTVTEYMIMNNCSVEVKDGEE